MNRPQSRIHWAFVPVAMVSTVALWIRLGPLVAIPAVLAGLGVGLYTELKGRQK